MSDSLFNTLKEILYPTLHTCTKFKELPSLGMKVCIECGTILKSEKSS